MIFTTANTTGTLTLTDNPRRKGTFVQETLVCAADLDHVVYKLPVRELIDLWVTRYGNDWVGAEVVEADEFFKHVHARLRSLGEIEQHHLTDRNQYVCRRPE